MADKNLLINFGNISAIANILPTNANILSNAVSASTYNGTSTNTYNTSSINATQVYVPLNASTVTPTISTTTERTNILVSSSFVGAPPVLGGYRRVGSFATTASSVITLITNNRWFDSVFTQSDSIIKTINALKFSLASTNSVLLNKGILVVKSSSPIVLSVNTKIFDKSIPTSSLVPIDTVLNNSNILKLSSTSVGSNQAKTISPNIQDYVFPTDDVLGEANIDDDQTAWVDKVVQSLPISIDTYSVGISKPIITSYQILSNIGSLIDIVKASTYSASSLIIALIAKELNLFSSNTRLLSTLLRNVESLKVSQVSVIGSVSNSLGKLLLSQYIPNSTILLNSSKVLSSSSAPTFSLSYLITWGRVLNSTGITVSNTIVDAAKLINTTTNSVGSSVSYTPNILKFSNSVSISSTFYAPEKVLLSNNTTLTTNTKNMSKLDSSPLIPSDNFIGKVPSIFKVATATSADSGTGVSQGYFADPTYSETQDYVGTLYTLT